MVRAFRASDLDRAWFRQFRQFRQPVYLAIGDRSHPIEADKARTLETLFPVLQLEVYAGRRHFDPPAPGGAGAVRAGAPRAMVAQCPCRP